MNDEKLTIQRAAAGDEAAMRALWLRHSPHVDAVVRRLVGNDQDLAADVAQEVWIQIFRALPQYRGDAQFGTWAHRIAVNRTLNALRSSRRLARYESDLEGGGPGRGRSWGTTWRARSRKPSGRCSWQPCRAPRRNCRPARAPCSSCTTWKATRTKRSPNDSASRRAVRNHSYSRRGQSFACCSRISWILR